MLRIAAGGRLHFGLIDVGRTTPRLFGGSGLALNRPHIVVTCSADPTSEVSIGNAAEVDNIALRAARVAVDRFCRYTEQRGAKLEIVAAPPQHVGLGVTTALVLSCLRLLDELFGTGLSRRELQKLSGRGGASGIGVSTFFNGGSIADVGHPQKDVAEILPSGAHEPGHIPPPIVHLTFPNAWQVRLVLPPGKRWAGEEEITFFRDEAPMPNQEVLETFAETYHGVLASIAEGDIVGLKEAFERLSTVGFKRREIDSHGNVVRNILSHMSEVDGVAAGMSSMGPLVFLIGDPDVLRSDVVTQVVSMESATDLGMVKARNSAVTLEQRPG